MFRIILFCLLLTPLKITASDFLPAEYCTKNDVISGKCDQLFKPFTAEFKSTQGWFKHSSDSKKIIVHSSWKVEKWEIYVNGKKVAENGSWNRNDSVNYRYMNNIVKTDLNQNIYVLVTNDRPRPLVFDNVDQWVEESNILSLILGSLYYGPLLLILLILICLYLKTSEQYLIFFAIQTVCHLLIFFELNGLVKVFIGVPDPSLSHFIMVIAIISQSLFALSFLRDMISKQLNRILTYIPAACITLIVTIPLLPYYAWIGIYLIALIIFNLIIILSCFSVLNRHNYSPARLYLCSQVVFLLGIFTTIAQYFSIFDCNSLKFFLQISFLIESVLIVFATLDAYSISKSQKNIEKRERDHKDFILDAVHHIDTMIEGLIDRITDKKILDKLNLMKQRIKKTMISSDSDHWKLENVDTKEVVELFRKEIDIFQSNFDLSDVRFSLNDEIKDYGGYVHTNLDSLNGVVTAVLHNAYEALTPYFAGSNDVIFDLMIGNNRASLASLKVSIRREMSNLLLEFKDNGPHGFSEELINSLAKNIRFTSKKLGNGLGLLHAKKMTEASDGSLKILRSDREETVVTLIFQIKE